MQPQGDYLSRLLHQADIGWLTLAAGMAAAFALGAVHALSPGHGKTIVAAYLVGTRGTPKHAAFLGFMVTFTHTISVFFLGLVTLYLSRFVLPEKITPVLGAVSGISIVWIGASLLIKRILLVRRSLVKRSLVKGSADVTRNARRPPASASNPLLHDHGDGHVHTHIPDEVGMAGLIALGASGGLVPCPTALVLLLSAVSLGRIALGLTLLVAFSAGLAVVLTAVGLIVLYAKHLLPDRERTASSKVFRYLPIASAAVIVCVGLMMTCVSLGWIRPDQLLPGLSG